MYRGEHGITSAQFQTRYASLSFGVQTTADLYATDPNNSHDFANCSRVFPVYLKIENPFMNDPMNSFLGFDLIWDQLGSEAAIEWALKYEHYIRDFDYVSDQLIESRYGNLQNLINENPEGIRSMIMVAFEALDDPNFVDQICKSGYDGAILGEFCDDIGVHECRAFNLSQIKSAIGNSGVFDPENPDITDHEGVPCIQSFRFTMNDQNDDLEHALRRDLREPFPERKPFA